MIQPELDPGFEPLVCWNRAYEEDVRSVGAAVPVVIGVLRGETAVARRDFQISPEAGHGRTVRYLERNVKCLLWIFGGNRILFSGPAEWRAELERYYRETEAGRFDAHVMGDRIFGAPISVEAAAPEDIPHPAVESRALGRHWDGCRIGFDLGGSDRKCAAVRDGDVVFSEEIRWDPYFQKDPSYQYDGVMDSLNRAAAHLPRVDAIGGSAAGVYVDNEVRIASLFRGVSEADFEWHVRGMFHRLKAAWNHVPLDVVNDGEVTALSGSMSLEDNAVLGISMGTSLAAGYVTPEGSITPWLNELAFVPVDGRIDGPIDEWSRDRGCGVQYFSQQGVARLADRAGFSFSDDQPLPERLEAVQEKMSSGDERARKIYASIGVCLGYTLAHYSAFYTFRHLLLLGRVTSGEGGRVIVEKAEDVLRSEFPDLAETVRIGMPDEKMKRHGQAVAAASLPALDTRLRSTVV